MTEMSFDEVDRLTSELGPEATIDRLIDSLRASRDYHRLFDALLLKHRLGLGLSLLHPTSFDDVPVDQQETFEERYVAVAREIGELFLADGNIPQAWLYFRTIREPEKVARAIDAIEVTQEATQETEDLIGIALYEGANPVKGLELLLRTHGTCNTITALDQQIQQMSPDDRRNSAALLVRELYENLRYTVGRDVEQREGSAPQTATLRELITGRDALFDEGNYHIDVSHLHSVVRFARFLSPLDVELPKAIELAEYGSKLAAQFQYPGDPPFDKFYPAHIQYFRVLADDHREDAFAYFAERLELETDPQSQQLIAYVMVDLLGRIGQYDRALEFGARYLRDLEASSGFSLARLCRQAGRLDTLREVAKERRDLVGYTAALLESGRSSASTSR